MKWLMQNTLHKLFVVTPRELDDLVATELGELSLGAIKRSPTGVSCEGTLRQAYSICLWSRVATRVLLHLADVEARDADQLYRGALDILWEEHLDIRTTFSVSATSRASNISNTHFAELRVKDAIVDQFSKRMGDRPDVEARNPNLRIHVHLGRELASLSIDLAGTSLHERGYRSNDTTGPAPIKENVAAAMLLRAGWPRIAREGGAFVDPLCGSGTLPIEAAMIAGDIAPGLARRQFGFEGWLKHDPQIWAEVVADAALRRQAGMAKTLAIYGSDINSRAITRAKENARGAGLQTRIQFDRLPVHLAAIPEGTSAQGGLLLTNPPYGKRLGTSLEAIGTYKDLGATICKAFADWHAAVLVPEKLLGEALGLRPTKRNVIDNGPIECSLWQVAPSDGRATRAQPPADDFANRLRKNAKRLGRWAQKNNITCYRLYDSDLPDYALAIDRYADWLCVQEYAPPKDIPEGKATRRLANALGRICDALDIKASKVVLKTRSRQRGASQYNKRDDQGDFLEVREGSCRFLVNLSDYLDTGLFLDHRLTRQLIGSLAKGTRFLNLFAYTGTATVHAALGGAISTHSIDMSNTYCEWTEKNLRLNGIKQDRHRVERADCLEIVHQLRGPYDLIFLDPPTFSNSKRMQGTFDVQRDHVDLIKRTASLLSKGGTLIFSNNFRRFNIDEASLSGLKIENITHQTISEDFSRNQRIHNCWRLTT